MGIHLFPGHVRIPGYQLPAVLRCCGDAGHPHSAGGVVDDAGLAGVDPAILTHGQRQHRGNGHGERLDLCPPGIVGAGAVRGVDSVLRHLRAAGFCCVPAVKGVLIPDGIGGQLQRFAIGLLGSLGFAVPQIPSDGIAPGLPSCVVSGGPLGLVDGIAGDLGTAGLCRIPTHKGMTNLGGSGG